MQVICVGGIVAPPVVTIVGNVNKAESAATSNSILFELATYPVDAYTEDVKTPLLVGVPLINPVSVIFNPAGKLVEK